MQRWSTVLTGFCFVVALASAAAAQSPRPVGTGAISGVVTDAATGQPLAGAVVTLATNARFARPVLGRMATDARGRFVFTGLGAANDYHLHVMRLGYFKSAYGVREAGETTSNAITLANAQWFREANLRLWRVGAVSGRVTDELGEPVVGAIVQALPLVRVAGVEQVAVGPKTTTDDRGFYRIAGLAAGRYVIAMPSVQSAAPTEMSPLDLLGMTPAVYAARVGRAGQVALPATVPITATYSLALTDYPVPPASSGGRSRAYPPTFYPGVRTIGESIAIEPDADGDLQGIDIRLQPLETTQVSGRVVGPLDKVAGMVLRMLPPGSEGLAHGAEVATTVVAAGGEFTFLNVPAGSYSLIAGRSVMQYHRMLLGSNLDATLPPPPGFRSGGMGAGDLPVGPAGFGYAHVNAPDDDVWAEQQIAVPEGGIADLIVTVRPTVAIRGTVVIPEGATMPPGFVTMSGAGSRTSRPQRMPVQAMAANGSPALGMPTGFLAMDTKTFEITGLRAGPYLLRFLGIPGVTSITWNGDDYSDRPFDAADGHDFDDVVVTVGAEPAVVGGTVTTASGSVAPGSTVIAFPVERERWSMFGLVPRRLLSTTADNAGLFELSLVAGEYHLVALPEEPAGWRHADFLGTVAPAAAVIRVDWGERSSVDLRLRGDR